MAWLRLVPAWGWAALAGLILAAVVGGVVATAGDGLAVTGSATINVKSTGTDGQPNNVLDLTAADNQSVVVTGSQNLTLTAKAATGTTGFSIDGSAFTGKLTVSGTAAGDIIKGGSAADTITGGDFYAENCDVTPEGDACGCGGFNWASYDTDGQVTATDFAANVEALTNAVCAWLAKG